MLVAFGVVVRGGISSILFYFCANLGYVWMRYVTVCNKNMFRHLELAFILNVNAI